MFVQLRCPSTRLLEDLRLTWNLKAEEAVSCRGSKRAVGDSYQHHECDTRCPCDAYSPWFSRSLTMRHSVLGWGMVSASSCWISTSELGLILTTLDAVAGTLSCKCKENADWPDRARLRANWVHYEHELWACLRGRWLNKSVMCAVLLLQFRLILKFDLPVWMIICS